MKQLLFFIFLFPVLLFAQNDSITAKKVYLFSIEEEIAPPATLKTEKALEEAVKIKADYIVLKINTFGGTLNDADKISTMLLDSKMPVYAFIYHNAASAGALIALSCDSIYMYPGSRIGAATVVDQTGEVVQADKYQSYMRSMMRSAAESHGRNPRIAEAMVDPRIYVEGVNDSGRVLTFTTEEALKHGYCEGSVRNVEELLAKAEIKNYEITEQELSPLHGLLRFLMHPAVSGILILLIVGGIYFELQTPGVGFPLVVAIIGAVLYFAPLYLEGLAANWEILIFLAGLGLLAVEIFVIPGFGVAGISGIVLIIGGLFLALLQNNVFDFSAVPAGDVAVRLSTVVISLTIGIGLSIYLSQKIITGTTFGHIALNTEQKASEGYTIATQEEQSMIGKRGKTLTVLRPSGKIEIDGNMYDGLSFSSFIEKDTEIEVIDYQNASLIVRKIIE